MTSLSGLTEGHTIAQEAEPHHDSPHGSGRLSRFLTTEQEKGAMGASHTRSGTAADRRRHILREGESWDSAKTSPS